MAAVAVMKMHDCFSGLDLLSTVAISDSFDLFLPQVTYHRSHSSNTNPSTIPQHKVEGAVPDRSRPPFPASTSTASLCNESSPDTIRAMQKRVKQRLSLILTRKLNVFRLLSRRGDVQQLVSDDVLTVRGASNRIIAVKGYYSFLQKRDVQDVDGFFVGNLVPMKKKRAFIRLTLSAEAEDDEPVRKCSHHRKVSFKENIAEYVYFLS